MVDDEPEITEGLSEQLSLSGYDAITAADGKEALRKVQLEKPDLIILDVVMPEMHGAAVCAALKGNPKTKDIPIVFLTGLRPKEDELRGIEVGGYPIFAKPFDFDELLATIRELTSRKKS